MELFAHNVRKSARGYGIPSRSRKKPCQMSLEPTHNSHNAAVISFAERRANRAPQAEDTGAALEQGTRARVAAVTDTCWCCRSKVRAVVGVIVEPELTSDGSGFLPLEMVDEQLIRELDERTLSRRGIGSLRHRDSPGVEGGYIANGCLECDALIGRFHLEDLLADHRNAGGSLGQLDSGIAVELGLAPAEQRRVFTAHG
jgi:hypothetical protein